MNPARIRGSGGVFLLPPSKTRSEWASVWLAAKRDNWDIPQNRRLRYIHVMVEPENLTLTLLRRLDEKLDRAVSDLQDVKARLTSVEVGQAGLDRRLDRVDLRLDRIERRLELVDAK